MYAVFEVFLGEVVDGIEGFLGFGFVIAKQNFLNVRQTVAEEHVFCTEQANATCTLVECRKRLGGFSIGAFFYVRRAISPNGSIPTAFDAMPWGHTRLCARLCARPLRGLCAYAGRALALTHTDLISQSPTFVFQSPTFVRNKQFYSRMMIHLPFF